MADTVFYSWQKDRPNSTNMSFIEKALERALGALSVEHSEISLEPNLDRDTKNRSGTPDIVQTIFSKIDEASAFVADVSIVASTETKGLPNPNVLIELGYAAGKLGWERIVCVCNSAYGGPEVLPFDLRTRRILFYKATPEDEKAEARNELAKNLVRALREVLTSARALRPSLNVRFRKEPSRFGIENVGAAPIEVLSVSAEFPRDARLENWTPDACPPVFNSEEFIDDSGRGMYRLTYVKTDAYCHNNPSIGRIPPVITPGQTFWCEALVVGFGRNAPDETPVKIAVVTREAGVVIKDYKLGELRTTSQG